MNNNLPTTPGVYWWRAKDGDEWRAIILTHVDIEAIQEDIPEFGEAYIDGMTISGGQWAKAHTPDEGVEAWAVFKKDNEEFLWSEPCLPAHIFTESAFICEPVTICRKGKE